MFDHSRLVQANQALFNEMRMYRVRDLGHKTMKVINHSFLRITVASYGRSFAAAIRRTI